MSNIIITIVLFIVLVFLCTSLYIGTKRNYPQIKSYKNSIMWLLFYNLNLILFHMNSQTPVGQMFIRLLPVLTIFLFASIYLDFYRCLNLKEKINLLL